MKVMMIDLDGTLFDTRMVNYLAYQEAIEPYGYSIDYKHYCNFCNGRHYLDFLPQITTTDLSILSDIHKRKVIAYKKHLNKAIVNWSLIDIIKQCKSDYKIALVTTASKQNTCDILKQFSLEGLFDLILTHDDVKKSKPNPEGYLKAMAYFGSSEEESVIFEDSDIGIQAAEKVGANVYVVKGYN